MIGILFLPFRRIGQRWERLERRQGDRNMEGRAGSTTLHYIAFEQFICSENMKHNEESL